MLTEEPQELEDNLEAESLPERFRYDSVLASVASAISFCQSVELQSAHYAIISQDCSCGWSITVTYPNQLFRPVAAFETP